jgi:hypothetical protein
LLRLALEHPFGEQASFVAPARRPAGRISALAFLQTSSGSLLVVHPKPLGAADRGRKKKPARFPARDTLREFEFPE